ncbi:hypothetical protein QT974_02260, partial [Microcoleus sp. herbarium12]
MIKHLSFDLAITVDEALAIVKSVMDGERFTEVQEIVFRLSWEGKSYQEMAQISDRALDYINDVGAQLWKQLSTSFGEKVSRSNLQSVIKRYLRSRQDEPDVLLLNDDSILKKSIMDELPLIELFSQLREAGFPLGIGEYKLLLEALQKGFGTSDRTSLYRLCKTLWVKSAEDKRLFDYHFELIVKESQEAIPAIPEKPDISAPETEDSGIMETAPQLTEQTSKPIISAPHPELIEAIEDEVQAAKAVMQATNKYEATSDRQFILTSEYFPVTRRQMKQSWRYLRRPVREGPPVELDVEATVNQIGRQGI